MYKTIWMISAESDEGVFQTKLTLYHFGKNPKFPSWYMEANHSYVVEMVQSIKLPATLSTFFKCLTHQYTIK